MSYERSSYAGSCGVWDYLSGLIIIPVASFGKKYVLFCGMTSPCLPSSSRAWQRSRTENQGELVLLAVDLRGDQVRVGGVAARELFAGGELRVAALRPADSAEESRRPAGARLRIDQVRAA